MGSPILDAHAYAGPWSPRNLGPPAMAPEDVARLYRLGGFDGVLLAAADPRETGALRAFAGGWSGRPEVRHAWAHDPRDPGNLDAALRVLEGVAAFSFVPTAVRVTPGDQRARPLLELAAGTGRPLIVDVEGDDPLAQARSALDAAARTPDLPMLLGARGGLSPANARRILEDVASQGLPSVRLLTSALPAYWLVRSALERLGPAQIIFGSGCGFVHPDVARAVVDHAGLSAVDRHLIFFGTMNQLLPAALRLRGIQAEQVDLPARVPDARAPGGAGRSDEVLDVLEEGVVVFDRQRRIRLWSKAMEEATGLSREAVLDRPAYVEFPFLVEKGVVALIDRAFAGETIESGTVRYEIPRTGRTGYRRSRFLPLGWSAGSAQAVVEIVRFVSQGAGLRAEGDEGARVRSLALLANGLATRLSNQLGVILGYTQVLRGDLRGSPAEPTLAVIEDATRKGFEITRTLFSFASAHGEQEEHLNLPDVVTYTVDALRLSQATCAPVEVTIDGLLPAVRGSETHLREALLHALKNACEALQGREDARIDLRLDLVELDETATTAADLPAGRFVRLQIKDTGPGIPEDQHEQVLRPFFTTKGRGRMGLGLNVVESAVRESGGFLQLRSAPGQGTTLEIFLPVA